MPPVLVSGLLALGLAASLFGLHVLLQGIGWWLASVAFALLVLGVAALTRATLRNRLLPTLFAAVAAVLGLTVGFASGDAVLGIIPSGETMGAFGELVRQGAVSVSEQRVPAVADPGILFLLSVLGAFTALWADVTAITLRQRAIAAAPLALPMVVPLAITSGLASVPVFVVVAAVWLWMLRLGRHRVPASTTLGVGATAVVAALLLPFGLPAVIPEPVGGTGGLQTRINPLIDLGDDLRRSAAVRALTYTTDSEAGLYLRLATLEEFSGRSWSPVEVPRNEDNTVDAFPEPQGITPEVGRAPAESTVSIAEVGGRWLPVPYPATTVTGLEGDWFWEDSGLSVRSSNTGVNGQEYTVGYLEVRPSREQLQFAGEEVPPGFDRFTELPSGLPEVIAETAAEVTDGAETNYDRAVALQSFFRDGDFTYSEDTPVEQGYDGTGAEVIARFLDARSGYCVHFASAMAVMARTLHIPSRVVVGFQPGRPQIIDGEAAFTVSTHDLHAWPELFFDGVGWVRFEPTVSRGELPDYSVPAPVDDPATPENEATESPEPRPSETSTAAPVLPEEQQGPTAASGDPTAAGLDASVLVGAGLVALAVLLLLSPAGLRAAIRGRRLRRAQGEQPAAAELWTELRDTARDHGWLAPPTETSREFAIRLASVLPGAAGPIGALRRAVEAEAYGGGRPVGADAVAALHDARAAIAAAATPKERLRAVLAPRSLTTRWVGEPVEASLG